MKRPPARTAERGSPGSGPMAPEAGWPLLMVTGLLLAGCVAPEPAATVAPTAPPLLIVTATPGLPPAATEPGGDQRYVVREGDTLSTIAERFDVSEAAIMQANNLSDPDHILVGQELIIPPPEP